MQKEQIIEGKKRGLLQPRTFYSRAITLLTYHLTFFVATPKQYRQLDSITNVKSYTQIISFFDFSSLVSLDKYKFASNDNIFIMTQDLNRIKVVLVEQKKTGKWLAEQLGVSACTVSRWASNTAQPNLSTLNDIAKLLGVDVKELINSEK